MNRPDECTDECLRHLDDFRMSSTTNMLEARPYLIEEFGFNKKIASDILGYWIKSFVGRHKEK